MTIKSTGIPGAFLSCNMVATRGFNSHNYVTKSSQTSTRKNEEFLARLGIKLKKAGKQGNCSTKKL